MDAARWLEAALGGGLPEPTRARWQPLRVGIVNLWEYDDEQFWFADGRLVLRGGNGAGKTKVLELTSLMLMRGEIGSSVLDPFGSQSRTMRFNLLPTGEADDPRPLTDRGIGYAWAEFARIGDDGEPRYYTCGLGASARRGTGAGGVSTWHLVSRLRIGKDLDLAPMGRPLEEKDLKKVDGVVVPPTAETYRAQLAADLFGLEPEAYDNLTDLLKQLRRPKLGERLDPTMLARTMRDALPPLSADEMTQLADGWDRLQALRQAVEQTEQAARATASFVRAGWRPWARLVLRRRADALAAATTQLDNTTRDKRAAETALTDAVRAEEEGRARVEEARARLADTRTAHRELLESRAYQDAVQAAERVEALGRELAALTAQLAASRARATGSRDAHAAAVVARDEAQREAQQAEAATGRAAGEVLEAASPAGLEASAAAHLPARDLPALLADHQTRLERFTHLRGLHGAHDRAARAVDRAADAVAGREGDRTGAAARLTAAEERLAAELETLQRLIRDWAAGVQVAAAPAETVERWCDAATALTEVGGGAADVADVAHVDEDIRAHVAGRRAGLEERRVELERRKVPEARRLADVEAELAEARSAREAVPPASPLWRRRARPGAGEGSGAPLWRCVQPRAGLGQDTLDTLEAALAAAGLLDAWVEPEGSVATSDGRVLQDAGAHLETVLRPAGPARPVETSLLAALEPTPAGGVGAEVVEALLARVGWLADADGSAGSSEGDWFAADGRWRLGPLAGAVEPAAPASYVGATAREAARQRRIAALEAERDRLAATIAGLDGRLAEVRQDAQTLAREERAIPRTRPLLAAVATVAERLDALAAAEAALSTARGVLADRQAARDAAWAELARFAGDHRFPLTGLDAVRDALGAYQSCLGGLRTALTLLEARTTAHQRALAGAETATARLAADEGEVAHLTEQVRQADVRLRTARAALGQDAQEQLARRDELETGLGRAEVAEQQSTDALTRATVAALDARHVLDRHEERRAAAESERDAATTSWWHAADAELFAAADLELPERRGVEAALTAVRAVRRDVASAADQAAEDRAWRACWSRLGELRQTLLPARDARIDDDPDAGSIPRVQILADGEVGWEPPQAAADTLAERVREQQQGFDAEQQRVLSTLLGSTFIEHLKDRLDYTVRTFDQINRRLAEHPTRQGHMVRLVSQADPADPDAGAIVEALAQGYSQLTARAPGHGPGVPGTPDR